MQLREKPDTRLRLGAENMEDYREVIKSKVVCLSNGGWNSKLRKLNVLQMPDNNVYYIL